MSAMVRISGTRRWLRLVLSIAVSLSVVTAARAAEPVGTGLAVQDIDTSKYPDVRVSVTVPPSMGAGAPSFSVAENGTPIDAVRVEGSADGAAAPQVLLLMDTSGSMAGQPLDDAKEAAKGFVRAMDDEAAIGILSFADRPEIVTLFTDDEARLDAAIDSLSAGGETSLYDALVQAAAMMPLKLGTRPSIVVLSDGGDSLSNASFEKTIGALREGGIPIYAVALKSDDYNPRALELLTKQTGGRLVPASKSSEFGSLFESLAAEISNVWTLSYTSARPRTADVDIDIVATSGERRAEVSAAYRNPALAQLGASRELTLPEIRENPMALLGAVLLAFFAVVLLVIGGLLIVLRDKPNLAQLSYYDQVHEGADQPLWGEDDVRSRVVDAVGYVAGKRGLTQLVSARLDAAGLPLRPAEYMTGHLLFVVVCGAVVALLTGRTLLAIGVVLLATVIPVIIVGIVASRRLERFQEQLPDVLNMISGSLRAGWGIQQAIGLCVQEAPKPSSTELKRVDTETRLGMPLEVALDSMANRMSSDDFRAVVTAVAVQREIGGNLAEVLDIVSRTIREREAVRRQIKSLTAEGRLSAYILVALPFVVFSIMLIINPSYLVPMLQTPVGIVILLFGLVLLAVGSVWVFAVTRIEV